MRVADRLKQLEQRVADLEGALIALLAPTIAEADPLEKLWQGARARFAERDARGSSVLR